MQKRKCCLNIAVRILDHVRIEVSRRRFCASCTSVFTASTRVGGSEMLPNGAIVVVSQVSLWS